MNYSEVTLELALKTLRKIVKERGKDWVYPPVHEKPEWRVPGGACRYFLKDGSPACIIGYLIKELDLPFDSSYEGEKAVNLSHLWKQSVGNFLGRVQASQDQGLALGAVLEYAEKDYKFFKRLNDTLERGRNV